MQVCIPMPNYYVGYVKLLRRGNLLMYFGTGNFHLHHY